MSLVSPSSQGVADGAVGRRVRRVAAAPRLQARLAFGLATLVATSLLVASGAQAAQTVLMGDGDLTYSEGFKTAPAGDMNGDGLADAAILKRRKNGLGIDDTVHVLYGTRSGTVPGSLDALGTAGFQILSGEQIEGMVPGGDFDGDGFDDLVVQRTSGFYVIYGAPGTADVNTQTEAVRMTKFPFKWGEVLAAGDFNGDGIDDLLANVDIASTSPGMPAYNTIVFGGPRMAAAPTSGARVFTITTPRRCTWVWFVQRCTGGGAITVKPVGDYSGDGRGDLAISTFGSRTATILLGRASGNAFDPAVPAPAGGYALVTDDRVGADGALSISPFPWINALDHGDRNGDGRADLIISSSSTLTPRIWGVYASPGGANTLAVASAGAPLIPGASIDPGASSQIGDFDGDGTVDRLAGNPTYAHPADAPDSAGEKRGAAVLTTAAPLGFSSPQKIIVALPPQPTPDPGLVGAFVDRSAPVSWWAPGGTTIFPDGTVQLTTASPQQAGLVYWPTPIDPANKTYEFDATISGGVGAGVGMTMGFGNKDSLPGTLRGAALGFGGTLQNGIAVALVTAKANRTDPSSNFVGITNGRIPGSSPLAMRWLKTGDPGISLRAGTFHVKVVTGAASIQVWVNGRFVVESPVALPASSNLQFTASTGPSNYQDHRVKNVSVR